MLVRDLGAAVDLQWPVDLLSSRLPAWLDCREASDRNGSRVWGLGFRFSGLAFRGQGLRCRVQVWGSKARSMMTAANLRYPKGPKRVMQTLFLKALILGSIL